MAKNHLTRLAAPKTWHIKRRGELFITKPNPGPHKISLCMPLNLLLKEVLRYADTTAEIKKVLRSNEIKIDGKSRKDFRFPVGIFDTIEFTSLNEQFRVILSSQGQICLVKISKEESLLKPSKIIGKTMVNGKLQINLYDCKNILVDNKSYKVGDTLVLSLPDQKVKKHLKLDKKSTIFLIGGKHIGEVGNVEDIIENKIIYRDNKENLVETSKKYAFVVGEQKPLITLE